MFSDREAYSTGQFIRVTLDVVMEALLGIELRIELLLTGGIEHIGRLVEMLAGRHSLQTGALALVDGRHIMTMTLGGFHLDDSVIELDVSSKHSR